MAIKPSTYTNWVADGAPTKVIQPPPSQLASGFVPGEPPAAQHINWVLHNLDQWTQYLDQSVGATAAANAGAMGNARLVGGGLWSFQASTGALTWTAPITLALVGIDDDINQIPAGSVVVPDGAVVYAIPHVPFYTSGTVNGGSPLITQLTYNQGIAVGQIVSGAGIPAGATVVALDGTTATLSTNALTTATGVGLSFVASGALAAAAADAETLQPQPNTWVIARRSGAVLAVGLGAGEMLLRDGEAKLLRSAGYTQVYTGVAGEALTAGQAVYLSPGGSADAGRTANRLYRADASITWGLVRSQCVGLVMSAAASGGGVQAIAGGTVNSLAGLTAGSTYYVSPTTPGALLKGRPTAGQWAAPVGIATSSTQLLANACAGSSVVASGGNQGTYGVFDETQLGAALTACSNAGGGVVVLQGAFTLSAAYVVPPATLLLGQLDQAAITFGASAQLTLDEGATLRDVTLVGSQATGTLLAMGNYSKAQNCRFKPLAGSSETCVSVSAVAVRLYNCVFVGCVGGTPIGVQYAGGLNNIDDSSVFT